VFKVLDKHEAAPNVHLITIEAPAVAAKCQAGQFAIVMVDERSERTPFSVADWDSRAGSVTLPVFEVGRSSRKVALLSAGDPIAHFIGPLGRPLEIERYGTVVCAAGCYGLGAMYPIARALKQAGNRVLCILEARSHYLFYFEDRLGSVCDELLYATMDGSKGRKGHACDVLSGLLSDGRQIDRVIAVGCPFMMLLCGEATKAAAVPTLACLNPIIVDGTGMCGACRVSVGGQTRFACVDGPFFDAHQVDWEELFQRQAAYLEDEVHAVGQTDAPLHVHQHP
jgi:NAD(P)H-flavin reductase